MKTKSIALTLDADLLKALDNYLMSFPHISRTQALRVIINRGVRELLFQNKSIQEEPAEIPNLIVTHDIEPMTEI